MAVKIDGIEPGSPGAKAGILPGDTIVSINGNAITDVLDYRFYMTDTRLVILLEREGVPYTAKVKKEEYDDLGLEFSTYLMDRQHHCKNKCLFCFVDQLPKGLRESLYFKDDDSRMSFFFGSYVTLTNMSEEEIRRIIKLHISPINISVHTTNPELRVKLLKNPNAAQSLRYIPMLVEAGIKVNTQLVLCPGINDGEELRRSLWDLAEYYPGVQSVALVPVGLTRHRQGLYPLQPMTRQQAEQNLVIAEEFGQAMLAKHGSRIAFAADEMFLIAGKEIPPAEYYEDFEQLEDGVGIYALLKKQFLAELEYASCSSARRELSLACGRAAEPLLKDLVMNIKEKFPNITVHVHGVDNRLFGDTVNVSGLLCGGDLAAGLEGLPLGERLLLPAVMLRHETDRFLDDATVPWLEQKLGTTVEIVEVDGAEMLESIIREEKEAG